MALGERLFKQAECSTLGLIRTPADPPTTCEKPALMLHTSGILLRALWSLSQMMELVKTALNAGSSKQGKARLASVASNWVTAMYLFARRHVN
jgi:hypothetical protein